MTNRTYLLAAAAVAAALSGCTNGMRQALGMEKSSPDEFAVVRRAPLVLPPEYSLRPPRPGESRPQELQPSQEAQAALLAEAQITEGERLFLNEAGALYADASIRSLIDSEEAGVLRKRANVVEHLLFEDAGDNALRDMATGGARPEIKKNAGLPGVF